MQSDFSYDVDRLEIARLVLARVGTENRGGEAAFGYGEALKENVRLMKGVCRLEGSACHVVLSSSFRGLAGL